MCPMEGNTWDFPVSAATAMCLRLCGSVCREGVRRVESCGSSALTCDLIHRTSQKGYSQKFVLFERPCADLTGHQNRLLYPRNVISGISASCGRRPRAL